MTLETNELSFDDRFVAYLERLKRDEDRAALAHLRRGLGKPLGTAIEMFPYVARWTSTMSNREGDAYFLISALFGLYPTTSWQVEGGFNDLGRSLFLLKDDSDSIERTFTALLSADEEDLPVRLRHIVSLLKAREKPVNWTLLLRDVKQWGRSDRAVQRRWARGFWGSSEKQNKDDEGGDR